MIPLPKLLCHVPIIYLTGDKVKKSEDRYAFILVSDEPRWNRLRDCAKTKSGTNVFIRKNVVGPKYGQKLLFYIKKPDAQIRGLADFVERLVGNSQTLWDEVGGESCFDSFDEYKTFIDGRENATFVRFTNLRVLEVPIPGMVFNDRAGFPWSPRGGKYLSLKEFSALGL